MRRLLLWILGTSFLLWWAGVLRPRRAPPRRQGPGERGPLPAGGKMVRDRICNTFLPRARALVEQKDGEEHFFCSSACRDAFLARVDPR